MINGVGWPQLIQRWPVLIAPKIAALDRSVDKRTQFTQTFGVVQYLAFGFQFLHLAGFKFRLLDFLDLEAQEFGAADRIPLRLLQ